MLFSLWQRDGDGLLMGFDTANTGTSPTTCACVLMGAEAVNTSIFFVMASVVKAPARLSFIQLVSQQRVGAGLRRASCPALRHGR